MRSKEEVKVELLRGARAVRQLEGCVPLGVGDIFRIPEEGLVRVHFISRATGDMYYRPLTLSQRAGYYYRQTVRFFKP